MPRPTISIAISEELARQLPPDPQERQEVLVLGLREWKVRKALEHTGEAKGRSPMRPVRPGSRYVR